MIFIPAQWWGPVPYMTNGRAGTAIDRIVLHTMQGTAVSADAWFKTPGRGNDGTSATYGVTRLGGLVQWVREKDTAWANGDWGMNLRAISVEHEDGGDVWGPRPDALYVTSAQLCADICRRYGFPADSTHMIPHHVACGGCTSCPDGLDVSRIISATAALLEASQPPTGGTANMEAIEVIGGQVLRAFRGASDGAVWLAWKAVGSPTWDGQRSLGGQVGYSIAIYDDGGTPVIEHGGTDHHFYESRRTAPGQWSNWVQTAGTVR